MTPLDSIDARLKEAEMMFQAGYEAKANYVLTRTLLRHARDLEELRRGMMAALLNLDLADDGIESARAEIKRLEELRQQLLADNNRLTLENRHLKLRLEECKRINAQLVTEARNADRRSDSDVGDAKRVREQAMKDEMERCARLIEQFLEGPIGKIAADALRSSAPKHDD